MRIGLISLIRRIGRIARRAGGALRARFARSFSVIARTALAVRGNLAERLKSSLRFQIAVSIILLFGTIAVILTLRGGKPAIASWFDDSWAYRNAIPISSHTAVESNVYISVTIDTSTSGQFQSDCGDLRFTKQNGELLPYYISSGCATATTVVHVFFDSFPAGAQTIYYYYGNSTVANGFSAVDFPTVATNYAVGSVASQEKTVGPVAYWKFDDGTGTNAQDSSPNNNDGTITGATWQTEDQCLSGKCLYFDGTNDVVTVANTVAGIQTVAFWVRPITTSEQFIDLNGSATLLASSGTITASGFTSPTIYVDGRVSSTIVANKWQYVSVTTGTALSGSAIKVGQISTNYGQAFFDDIKIYNYARTAAQVKADYNSRGSSKGLTLRTQGQTLPDVLSNGLVGYWKMDESSWTNDCTATSVTDSSGNGNNGKACPASTGPTGGAAGKFGNGGSFDGSDDYVSVGSVGITISNTSAFSMGYWFNANDQTGLGTKTLVDLGTGFQTARSNNAIFQTSSGAGQCSSAAFSISTWNHVVFTHDANGTVQIFLNGDLAKTCTNVNLITGASSVSIGNYTGGGSYNFSGKIDETRIYNRALSPREVRDLYNWAPGPVGYWNFEEGSGQSANDTSGNGNTGTLGASSSVSSDDPAWNTGKYGKGLSFDGSNDLMQVTSFVTNNINNTYAFTVEGWVKPSQSRLEYFFGGGTYSPRLGFSGSSGILAVVGAGGTSFCTTSTYTNGVSSYSANNWVYITLSMDANGNYALYKNGVSIWSGQCTPQKITDTGNLYLGTDTAHTSFNGLLDDFKYYNYARTQKQIVEDMSGGAGSGSARNAGAVGYWKFDEGYGTTANDTSINANNLTLSSASWTNSGKFGKAWNGTNTLWLSRADDADFDVTATDDYGISLWFKSDSATNPSAAEYLVNKASSVIAGYAVYANTSGQICFGIDDDTTWNPDIASCSTADFYDAAWHHIAAIRDTVQDKTYNYIDGVLRDSDSDTTTATLANSLSLYVGDRDGVNNGDEFAGDIDELKIYRYALTSDEVKTEYNQGAALKFGAVSTESDASTASNAAARGYCIPGDASACSAPVGEWNFEEGTTGTSYDTSGNGYNGTDTGTAVVSGKIGKARKFNGSSDVISTTTAAQALGTSDFTLESWVNYTAINTGASFGGGGIIGTTTLIPTVILGINSNNLVVYTRDSVGTTQLIGYSASNLSLNKWYHVVGVRQGTSLFLYVNGVQVGTTTGTVRDVTNGETLKIGKGYLGYTNGSIDQVRIFNYARTSAQIAWDYNRGGPVGWWKFDECQGTTAFDAAGNGNAGTITEGGAGTNVGVGNCGGSAGTMWKDGATGKFNSSLEFDGTDDYTQITDTANLRFDASTADFSLFAWVKRTTTGTEYIISKEDADNDGWRLMFNSGNQVLCSEDATDVTSTSTITDTNWHLVGCTIDRDGNGQTYIDGRADGAAVAMGTDAMATTSNIRIATRSYTSTNYLNGQIDDVKIFNYALTATQVKTEYNQGSAIRFGPASGSP